MKGTNPEIQKLLERKQELEKAIAFTKEKKQEIIKLINSPDNKTAEQWLKYYNDYLAYYDYQIKLCNSLIKKEQDKKKVSVPKTIQILKFLIICVLAGILISLFFTLKPVIFESSKQITEKLISPETSFAKEEITFSESTTQAPAVLTVPVKWKKQISLDQASNIKLELPAESEKIKLSKFEGNKKQEIKNPVIEKKSGFFRKLFNTDKTEIEIQKDAKEYELEYETPAPEIKEETIGNKKKVTISSPEDIHYENVLSFSKIQETAKIGEERKIRLFQIKTENGKEIRMRHDFNAYDTDENNFIDTIEWTSSLSQAVFEIEIIILNIQSYPMIKGNWTVAFETKGTADLKITATNRTSWSNSSEDQDLKFLEIKCNDKILNYEWFNNSVFIKDYSCDETSYETSKVLTKGKHDLEFDFGGEKAYAHNYAGTSNTRISNGNDDVEERQSNGAISFTSTDLELVNDGAQGNQHVGLRFQNIQIPQGALINNAYIEFEADEAGTAGVNNPNLIISAHNNDNAPAFSSTNYDVSSRQITTNTIPWLITGSWVVNSKYQTPNIASIIQEIINRQEWQSGNSIVLIIEGTGRRTAEAYNGESANAPLLVIDYSVDEPPITTLNSPEDQTTVSTTDVTLTCSAIDDNGLVDITLYGDWGGWGAKQTLPLSGIQGTANFQVSLSDRNTYTWNCLAQDTDSQTSFAPLNYIFNINTQADATPPLVTLNSPLNGVTIPDTKVSLTCSAQDETELKDITLYYKTRDKITKTLSFREDGSFASQTDDTQLNANSPTTNYGSLTEINVDGQGPHAHGIIKFPNIFGSEGTQIPYGATILQAELTINIFNPGDNMIAYRLNENWIESQTNWNNKETTSSWLNPGADIPNSADSSYSEIFQAPTGINIYNVRRFIQDWSNGLPNYGIVLTDTGTNGIDFYSSENPTLTNRPLLSVTFEYYETLWHAEQTQILSGTQDSATFELNLKDDTAYEWNCLAEDLSDNQASASSNYSFTLSAPFPEIIYGDKTPTNGATNNINSIFIDTIITENNFNRAEFNLYDSTQSLIDTISKTEHSSFILANYNLITDNSDLSLIADSSGIAYNPSTNSLFIIHNNNCQIDETDLNGNLLRTISLSGFEDCEGISYAYSSGGDDWFAIVEERRADLNLIKINPLISSITYGDANTINYELGLGDLGNTGLEGITYDTTRNLYYAVKEKTPKEIYQIDISTPSPTVTTLFNAETQLNYLNDLSDLYYDENTDSLFILSHESSSIARITLSGLNLENLAVAMAQPEGITFDNYGDYLYVIGEPDYFSKWRTTKFTSSHEFTGLADGVYYYDVTAYNNFGKQSTTERRIITIDTQVSPPTIPNNIQCNGNDNCDILITDFVNLQASGSTDPDGDEITYFIEALLNQGTCSNIGSCSSSTIQTECGTCSLAGCNWGLENRFTDIHYQAWESGAGGWLDPGTDSERSNVRSNCQDDKTSGGIYSWYLRSNTASAYTEHSFDFTGYDRVDIKWSSFFTNIEGTERLELKCDGNVIWSYQPNTQGTEDRWLSNCPDGQCITIYPSNCNFDNSVTLRFEAELSSVNDHAYLDCVDIKGVEENVESCSGTLDCSIFNNKANCETCNQCTWTISQQWQEIGNHLQDQTFNWDVSALSEQECIDLRTKAIDLTGSNTYLDYFTKNSCLDIKHFPEIVFISDINGKLSDADVPSADRDFTAPGGTTSKTFEFYVYHPKGVNSLPGPGSGVIVDDSNALLILRDKDFPNDERKSSDSNPNAATCVYARDDIAPLNSVDYAGEQVRVYSCAIAMQYYDDYGSSLNMNWEAKAIIKDIFGNEDSDNIQNLKQQFVRDTYFNPLQSSQVLGENPDFGTIDYQVSNIEPINPTGYPLIVENQGNTELNPITVTGYNIPGITDNTKLIQASWFKVDTSTPCTTGNSLIDSTIVESKLSPINHGASASKELKFCLTGITTAASPQDYSTAGGNSWIIDISYVIVIISLRKRKQIKKDNLMISLNLISEELSQEYSPEKQKIIKLLKSEIKNKYRLNNKELSDFIEIKKEIKIPLGIFRENIGILEIITKYLKENLNMSYHEISELLNRNERTVWTAYYKARQKIHEEIKISKQENYLPIQALVNKNMTLFESLVLYLKEKLKYIEIAKLLNRDQRNIWTIYSRAIKKQRNI